MNIKFHNKMMKRIFILFIVFSLLSSCSKTEPSSLIKKSHILLGTFVEITVADSNKSPVIINSSIKKAFAEIERVEGLLSRYNPESEISRINVSADKQPMRVSAETLNVIVESIMFSKLTDGAFDITSYPLIETWGLDKKSNKKSVPPPGQIKEVLNRVGYQNIDIIKEKQSVFLTKPLMCLDLGGVAKGYAVDRAIKILKQKGIKNALVNAGGDIYALGRRSKDRKWRIAVRHPRKPDVILTILELENEAVATSGDYQKFIEIDGKRYSHIINPKTGSPCGDVPASITVLAESCLAADALATSVFVLGPVKGIDLIDKLENTEAIAVSVKGARLDILLSQGLNKKLKLNYE